MTKLKKTDDNVKRIIFDYGGVFTNGSRAVFLTKSLGQTQQEQETIRQFLNSDYIKQAARGKWTTNELIAHLQSLLENSNSDFIRKILAQACTADTKMLQLVKKLSRKYQVYLISDSLPPYSDFIALHYNLFFKYMFMSDKLGLRKSEGLFQHSQKICPHLYDQAIYIDDREQNLKLLENKLVAKLVFTSYKTLIKDLNQYGVDITNDEVMRQERNQLDPDDTSVG